MAEAAYNTNRREFLSGSAAIVTTLAATANPNATHCTTWDACMARWEAAKHEEQRFLDTVKALRDTVPVVDEQLLQLQLAADLCEADLMQAKAPNPEALRWKVERLIEVERNCCTKWPTDYIQQTKIDMVAIMGGGL